MKLRNIFAAAAVIILTLTALMLLPAVYTTKDRIDTRAVPAQYAVSSDTSIEAQKEGQCAAYAAAYVLRSLGKEADTTALIARIRRIFVFVTPGSVAALLRDYGCDAKAYHGDIAALKAHVSQGTPVIVFMRIPNDTHYAVVTGYDEEYLYLADPMPDNANADGAGYNRRIATEEFEALWKTPTLLSENVYIAVIQNAERQ